MSRPVSGCSSFQNYPEAAAKISCMEKIDDESTSLHVHGELLFVDLKNGAAKGFLGQL
jgi:hypothetical protein